VEIGTALTQDDSMECTVTDNGPGIAAGMADQLFKPFKSNKVSGMGVGLSICRSIIEAHGGKIWVDPARENGARFGFSLPLSHSAVTL
jgi:two-component system sensor kinase FixL